MSELQPQNLPALSEGDFVYTDQVLTDNLGRSVRFDSRYSSSTIGNPAIVETSSTFTNPASMWPTSIATSSNNAPASSSNLDSGFAQQFSQLTLSSSPNSAEGPGAEINTAIRARQHSSYSDSEVVRVQLQNAAPNIYDRQPQIIQQQQPAYFQPQPPAVEGALYTGTSGVTVTSGVWNAVNYTDATQPSPLVEEAQPDHSSPAMPTSQSSSFRSAPAFYSSPEAEITAEADVDFAPPAMRSEPYSAESQPPKAPPLNSYPFGSVQSSHLASIFVFHLPSEMDDSALFHLFSPFGQIHSVKVVSDKQTGQSRGYGFVNMFSIADANRAIAALNGYKIGNKYLKVEFKSPAAPTTITRRPRRNTTDSGASATSSVPVASALGPSPLDQHPRSSLRFAHSGGGPSSRSAASQAQQPQYFGTRQVPHPEVLEDPRYTMQPQAQYRPQVIAMNGPTAEYAAPLESGPLTEFADNSDQYYPPQVTQSTYLAPQHRQQHSTGGQSQVRNVRGFSPHQFQQIQSQLFPQVPSVPQYSSASQPQLQIQPQSLLSQPASQHFVASQPTPGLSAQQQQQQLLQQQQYLQQQILQIQLQQQQHCQYSRRSRQYQAPDTQPAPAVSPSVGVFGFSADDSISTPGPLLPVASIPSPVFAQPSASAASVTTQSSVSTSPIVTSFSTVSTSVLTVSSSPAAASSSTTSFATESAAPVASASVSSSPPLACTVIAPSSVIPL